LLWALSLRVVVAVALWFSLGLVTGAGLRLVLEFVVAIALGLVLGCVLVLELA